MAETTASLSTELLRTSDDPLFRPLRALLPEHGVDLATDVLAELFPDDTDQEFGVVVTADLSVFTFALHYGRKGDLKNQSATAVLADWTDISSQWETSAYASNIRDALDLLQA